MLSRGCFRIGFIVLLMWAGAAYALSDAARKKGFVELSEADSTIIIVPRYATDQNFLGTPVDGYKKQTVVVLKEVAQAFKLVQAEFKKAGYCMVVYDAYRPQRAVDHFMRWIVDATDQKAKAQYYPRVDKSKAAELGYIAPRSGHTRGSRVDVTLIKDGKQPHAIMEKSRKLSDGFTITYLDDGTIDMGSSFDLFDEASHTESALVDKQAHERRMYLKSVMEKHGFEFYENEWWHFSYIKEPYAADQDSSYFDFVIE